ncbi:MULTISPECIES: Smr/MutS family protein [Rhizobium]|uniref:Smr/MutS family protein n=1 Tax=Rhizobium rhododendri TaxID=2506430 RepID=A0ABY8IH06_9HYPH|nr:MULTISPECIES: Smr/MutS family protein [Rhizobium]MBO9100412.1 Smr/MutS family protein [Rhizobium sp. L58/93]MBO9135448.1 Smr/MutS family protein [Rhizobium sp. B209b/85]MBO9170348.1 Smr/MutS family protein [Rhizobium sp. L245/93]MBO9186305.1 Smr/MutS family protein [Rhizobium sp. E27B/91]MBZ5760589.1 Smr/MutS family protein [Rhizobium sp. VS19-DR96]
MAKDRKLSPEERILWSKVAKSTRPLPQHMAEMQALDIFLTEQQAAEAQRDVSSPPPPKMPISQQPLPMPQKPQPSASKHHPLERPVKRKIAKGRLPLEARIDLHGLYQDEAHDLLLDFLVRAHMRGLRHVLVITGKGSSMGSEGALKRAAPLWFSKPDFRYLISSYETAAQHHGGEGALYIRLARRPGDAP